MRVEINREQYESLKAGHPKGIKFDMECKYFMEFTPATQAKTNGKRKKPRSPLSIIVRGPRWKHPASNSVRQAAKDRVGALITDDKDYMASGELSAALAARAGVPNATGSYWITCLLEEGILAIDNDR